MKQIKFALPKKLFFFVVLVAISSCATKNPLLTENIVVNSHEDKILQRESQEGVNPNVYQSNLNNFTYPTLTEVMAEAKIHRHKEKLFAKNATVLSSWITKDLTRSEMAQLNKNCEFLVGRFDKKFPLDATTIACAAWWIDKKNAFINLVKNNNAAEEVNYIHMTSSQKKNWLNFRGLTLSQALSMIDGDSLDLESNYIHQAVQNADDCSLKNANSALILKLENRLPDPKVYSAIEKIYGRLQTCLKPNQEPSEKIHLRMGIIRLGFGNVELAKQSFEKTQKEADPKENSRSLFWLGAIFRKNHPLNKENIYWKQLIYENPLAMASLVAQEQMGVDPMSTLLKDENIALSNRVEGGWTKENLEAYIFDVLRAKKDMNASDTWAHYVARRMTTTNTSLLMYWAYTQNKLHSYFDSIITLSRYSRYQKKQVLSPGFLKLQFPTPFLNEISRSIGTVDPVLVLALMRQESAFDETARSSANAYGLMQLLPSTAKSIKHSVRTSQLYDPDLNIKLGTLYLEKLFKQYKGKAEYVLASYNAGTFNLDKWLVRFPVKNTMLFSDFIPYKETRNYVSIILRNYYWYSKILERNKDKLSQTILKRSEIADFKPHRIKALIAKTTPGFSLSDAEKNILNEIYSFGTDAEKGAISFRPYAVTHKKP